MARTKVISEAQKKKLGEIKDQYRFLTIIDHDQFGKLFYPEIFHYGNKPRLYNEVKTNIDNFLDSFDYAFKKLPDSYKNKILINRRFNDFINQVLGQLEYTKRIRKDDKDLQDFSYQLYLQFFNIGINGLIRTMPEDFQPYLVNQLQPVLSLMSLIGKYENLKFKYPSLNEKDQDRK